jgi:hypothetical protein
MESIKKNKVLLSMFVITLVAFIYYFFFSGSGSSTPAPSVAVSGQSDQVGSQVLQMLNQISTVQIDQSLFTSTAWLSLKDISSTLPNDIPGKNDLFSPLGSK